MMLVIVGIGVEREGKGGEVCDWIEVIFGVIFGGGKEL